MKGISKLGNAIILLMAITSASAQTITLPPSGGNQKSSVSQWMGPVMVSFSYNSPDVTGPNGEDRTGQIWGGLVPYGMNNLGFGAAESSPWRAGANENTVFTTTHDILIEGQKLPAGSYGFFMVVNETEPWTIIFSGNTSSWGSYYYEPEEDVLRVEVQPEDASFSEWLTYGFDDRELDHCTAFLHWEKKKIPFSLEVENVHQLYQSILADEMRGAKGFDWRNLTTAARYLVQQNMELQQALQWAETALTANFIGQRNFQTLETKAMVLDAMGKGQEAESLMSEAIKLPEATIQDIHFYGRRLLNEGKTDQAVEIFEYNRKAHRDDKFTTVVGLARGYAAQGNNKKAIKMWEQAIENLPENQKPFLQQYQDEIEKLKN